MQLVEQSEDCTKLGLVQLVKCMGMGMAAVLASDSCNQRMEPIAIE